MQKNNANVIAKPPFIFLGFIAAGLLINNLAPLPIFTKPIHWPVYLGYLIIIDGMLLALLAFRQFKLAATPIDTSKSVTHMVTSGIYRYTRNPIYLGMILAYLGIALVFNNAWLLAELILLLPTMYLGVILREEKYLERLFEDEYRDYRNRVRRWI